MFALSGAGNGAGRRVVAAFLVDEV
jgi:hypothetical protein